MGIVLHHDSHTTPVRLSLFSPPRPVVLLVRRVTKITHLRLYCDKQSLATGPEGGPSCRQLLFLNTFSGPEYHMLVTGVRRRELACFVTASCFLEVGGGSLTSAALTPRGDGGALRGLVLMGGPSGGQGRPPPASDS